MKLFLHKTKSLTTLLALITLLLLPGVGWGQTTFSWNFGTSSVNAAPSSGSLTNLTVGNITIGNSNGTVSNFINTTSPSSGYTGASATYNAGNAARTGALNVGANGSAYFEFTLTPATGYTVSLNSVAFGTRGTSTAPQAYTLRSSKDSYATDIAIGTIANNSTWALKSNTGLTFSGTSGTAVTFRLFGYNGAGSPGSGTINWRIDDLSIVVTLSGGADVTPPTWTLTYPKADNATTDGFTAKVNIDEPGTSYLVVLPNDATAPSSAQVKAGQDAAGNGLASNLKGTISCAAANTEYTLAITGLSSSTAYDVYFVAQDDETTPNLQASPVKADVSTTAPTPTIATPSPILLSGFSTVAGTASNAQIFTISGTYLTGNLVVTAPADFEVRENETGSYGASVSFTPSSGTVATKTIQVRIAASASLGTPTGNVVCSSTDATSQNVEVIGTVSAPPDPEPSNYPTGFSAVANSSSQITLTWTDATGTQVPSGYLIKAAIAPATPDAPEDGTAEDDAALVKNIVQGVGEFAFTGLSSETTYNFSIWPYTNSGSAIDYKVIGQPTASAMTPSLPWTEDFETGTKTSYAAGDVICTKGSWNLSEAVIGTLANDRKNGLQSVRMRYSSASLYGEIKMNFDKSNGAGIVTVYHAYYGTDGSGSWKLQMSTNAGSTWSDVGSTVNTTATALTAQNFAINQTGNVRFKIIQLSGNRINIDDFKITDYSTPVFTGTGNWTETARWSNGTVPIATENVIIEGNAIVNDVVSCNTLIIASSGTVTVGSGQGLSVNGNFLIESDASGTGSFIGAVDDYDIAGTQTVQHYISGAPSAWHLLSSPVAAQDISGDFTPTGDYPDASGYDTYAWDEPTETWLNQKDETNNILTFVPGKGYLVAYEATNPTKTFTGELNEGIYLTPVTVSGTGEYSYSTLVGNPYPSSIDWKIVAGFDKSDLEGFGAEGGVSHYIWNQAFSNYGVYSDANVLDGGTNGATRYIAPMQGFFVVAAQAGDFGIDNDARVHSTQAWLKSGDENSFRLSVGAPATFGADELLLEFGHESSLSGAEKWNSFVPTAPGIYTPKDGTNYSISFLTSVSDNPLVPVAFKAGVDGSYNLSADYNTAEFSAVTLSDIKTGTTQNLKLNPVYTFNASTGDDVNRFTLHFSPVGIDNPTTGEAVQVYVHSGLVYLNGAPVGAEVRLADITGRVVKQVRTGGDSLTTLNVSNLPHGIYVVTIISGKELLSRKIILQLCGLSAENISGAYRQGSSGTD